MIRVIPIFFLALSTAVVSAETVIHAHDNREHSHPLPKDGLKHTHGTSGKGYKTEKTNTVSKRFEVNSDNTISDHKLKIIWVRCTEGAIGNKCENIMYTEKYNWHEAMQIPKGKVPGADGGTWRLPTKNELLSIVYCSNRTSTVKDSACNVQTDGGHQIPTINTQLFPNTFDGTYWSSDTKEFEPNMEETYNIYPQSDYAHGVYFSKGNYNTKHKVSGKAYVRLVRDMK